MLLGEVNDMHFNSDLYHLYQITGEIDNEGRACGVCKAVRLSKPKIKYEGTFQLNRMHGLCKTIFY